MITVASYTFPPYRTQLGLPAHWRDDVSGTLPSVVMAYFAHGAARGQALTHEQLVLLRAYLEYFINAPCWQGEEIAPLRARISECSTEQEIDAWIESCLEIGIDPL